MWWVWVKHTYARSVEDNYVCSGVADGVNYYSTNGGYSKYPLLTIYQFELPINGWKYSFYGYLYLFSPKLYLWGLVKDTSFSFFLRFLKQT